MHLFSCDWGTSRFRLRLLAREDARVLDEVTENCGVRDLQNRLGEGPRPDIRAAVFSRFLRERVNILCARSGIAAQGLPVIVSGMASSSVGWRELPYASTPFPLDGSSVVLEEVPWTKGGPSDPRVWLVSGVRTETDLMRGEECEVLGAVTTREGRTLAQGGVMVLPGTHSKHVWLRNGVLTDFHTFITGELGDVLARHSLLRHSVRWPLDGDPGDPTVADAFEAGVRAVGDRGLSQALFRVRTRTVIERVDPALNGWYFSGLLIGDEVRRLLERASDLPIMVVGAPVLSQWYQEALGILGAAERIRTLPEGASSRATVWAHVMLADRLQTEIRPFAIHPPNP